MTFAAAQADPPALGMDATDAEGDRQALEEALCSAIDGIHRRGWCEGTGGNFSVVVKRQPLRVLMAPSGVDKGAVRPQSLIEVDGQGAVVQGAGKASAETLLHLQIIRQCGAGAVLHTHSPAATLLSRRQGPADGQRASMLPITGYEMLKGLEGVTTHQMTVEIPVLANDQDIARLAEHALSWLPQAPHGLLVAGHGLYAWGQDLEQARRHLEVLEFLLEQLWRELLLDCQRPPRQEH